MNGTDEQDPQPLVEAVLTRRTVTAFAAGAAVASLIAVAGPDVPVPDGGVVLPSYVGGGIWGGG